MQSLDIIGKSMDTIEIITIVVRVLDGLISLGLMYYAYRLFGRTPKTVYFAVFMIGTYLTIAGIFDDEAISGTWIRHLIFYASQLFFYFFISNLIAQETSGNLPHNHSTSAQPVVMAMFMSSADLNPTSLKGWGVFMTNQGLQHILTAPLFFVIVAKIRMMSMALTSKNAKTAIYLLALSFFFVNLGLLISIHIQEFLVESQRLIPLPEDISELMETGWFLAAGIAIFVAFSKIAKAQYGKQNS